MSEGPYVDVAIEALASALHIAEHGVSIADAFMVSENTLRLALSGEGLSPGQHVAIYHKHGDQVVLQSLDPVAGRKAP